MQNFTEFISVINLYVFRAGLLFNFRKYFCIHTENYLLIMRYFSVYIQTSTFVPGSSVGIATDYRLDGPGIEFRWGEIFLPSRPDLGPIHPPIQRVPVLSRG
jgi:hypothetical protein